MAARNFLFFSRQCGCNNNPMEAIDPKASIAGQSWNTGTYAANGRFVANLATEEMVLSRGKAGEQVLTSVVGTAH